MASRVDPAISFARTCELARVWGARLFDGAPGGVDPDGWAAGEDLLDTLLIDHYAKIRPATRARIRAEPASSGITCAAPGLPQKFADEFVQVAR